MPPQKGRLAVMHTVRRGDISRSFSSTEVVDHMSSLRFAAVLFTENASFVYSSSLERVAQFPSPLNTGYRQRIHQVLRGGVWLRARPTLEAGVEAAGDRDGDVGDGLAVHIVGAVHPNRRG